jgi:hypothetical protein
VEGLVPLELELWQGGRKLLDTRSMVVAASAHGVAAAEDLARPDALASMAGARSAFMQDLSLLLSLTTTSPTSPSAPELARYLLAVSVRHGLCAVAQVLHALASRSPSGGKDKGLSAQQHAQLLALARCAPAGTGAVQLVQSWAASSTGLPLSDADTAGKPSDLLDADSELKKRPGLGTGSLQPASWSRILRACILGFPDGPLECEYAKQHEALSRSWRLFWHFLSTIRLLTAAILFTLRKDDPVYRQPSLWVGLGHLVAGLAIYLSPKQDGKGRSVVAPHPHPWHPRRHELVGLLFHLYISILCGSISSFLSPAGLSHMDKTSERLLTPPMVRGSQLLLHAHALVCLSHEVTLCTCKPFGQPACLFACPAVAAVCVIHHLQLSLSPLLLVCRTFSISSCFGWGSWHARPGRLHHRP